MVALQNFFVPEAEFLAFFSNDFRNKKNIRRATIYNTFCNISILNILKIFTVSFEIVIEPTIKLRFLKGFKPIVLSRTAALRFAILPTFSERLAKKKLAVHTHCSIPPLFFPAI